MSSFGVFVKRISEIYHHPNADRLDIAQVDDYQCIVLRNEYKSGDLVAYIPEQSIVSQRILEEMGLEGKLSGSDKNRVKAIRLRGIVSQGLCYKAKKGWNIGDNVAEELGIVKWEPPIPTYLRGEVEPIQINWTLNYDVENFKAFPNVLKNDEIVVFTEKIHGTFFQAILDPEGNFHVGSKGLGARGLVFKDTEKNNEKNLYVRASKAYEIERRMKDIWKDVKEPRIICGEVFGQGVQDLFYGASVATNETIGFRIFDVYEGFRGSGRFLNSDELDLICDRLGLYRVPLIYSGPFSKDLMIEYTKGNETVSGMETNIREGIVVRPTKERHDLELGRVQLKSVSEDYLFRKDGTEFN